MIRKLDLPDSAAPRDGARMTAPSAARNLGPIQDVLADILPASGTVLELASGTGEHVVAHARRFPGLSWHPTEPDAERRASIDAWAAEAGLSNVAAAEDLDACAPGWGARAHPVDVVLLVNLLHLISEAEMAVLLDEAAQALGASGRFIVYGPFLREGEPTSEGDAAFHAKLQAQDGDIGYKDLGVLCSVLEALQMRVKVQAMPANNVMVVAVKTSGAR